MNDNLGTTLLTVAGTGATFLLSALVWSLKKNLRNLESQGERTERKLDALSGAQAKVREELSVSQSDIRALAERVGEIGGRVTGLEARERTRGCYDVCPPRAAALKMAQYEGG